MIESFYTFPAVMAGLAPAIHDLKSQRIKSWMPATRAGMTVENSLALRMTGR